MHDSDLIHLLRHQQLYQRATELISDCNNKPMMYVTFYELTLGFSPCTCYRLVTVLINMNASGVQIYYSAPGLKLGRVSHYTA